MDHKFKKSNAEVKSIKGIQFSVINPEYIRNISVTQRMEHGGNIIEKGITSDTCYNPETGQPNFGGINDPRMGNMYDSEHPGYFGHIDLVTPVYHIGFLKIVIDILRCVSYYTSTLLIDVEKLNLKPGKKRNIKEITRLSKTIKKCPITQQKLPNYTKEGTKIAIDFGDGKQIINPSEVYKILEKISNKDVEMLGFNVKYSRPEWFLLKTIPVPPPHVRPSVFMSSSQKCDDDLTTKLNEIVKANISLATAIEKSNQNQNNNEHYISQLEYLLQYNVNTFIDNQHPGQPQSLQRSGKPLKTLRERLAGKDGRVRGNLMGKRVDFSARTVITADPNLSIDQVGVPKSIALNLTIPETVTNYNKSILLKLVKNGPNNYPGAKFLIKNAVKIDLHYCKEIKELKNGWIVERHLIDDDIVLFNRQPSLHKMSIMAHRVKVLNGSTFRLNLAVTSPYNADFDGDEMNLHVPQSINAKVEAENLMMVDKMIVSPQSNKPVMGIIQDSLLSSTKMTRRNVLIEKDQLMNMLMIIDNWNGIIPNPAVIYKGKEYWTGKQIFSIIIPEYLNINQMKQPEEYNPQDRGILIQNGEILSGSVDKSIIGKTQGGLIHILFNDCGPSVTKIFFNQVQKLANYWIKQHGYSIGVGDAIATPEAMSKVEQILKETREKIEKITLLKSHNTEELINAELNAATNLAGNSAEQSLTFNNNFKAAVSSGSKGSSINISQIMAAVGQQNVEGKRIGYGFKGRTLPHFERNDVGQKSRGFVENNYLKGLNPEEFFFHCMAGREGLIDTSCKTSEVGYTQRRLVKALEDVSVRYDNTVRNSKGLIIQFLYGEDGMDATYLENIHIKFIEYDKKKLREIYYSNDEEFDNLNKLQNELIYICKNVFKLTDNHFPMPANISRIINYARSLNFEDTQQVTQKEVYDEVCLLVSKISDMFKRNNTSETELKRSYNASRIFCIYVHSMLAYNFIKDLTSRQLIYISEDIELKFRKAIVNPGEMTGILTAQSIGEPVSQMTLNSFHWAGVSAKNVTLGVPRLKELINITKKIRTPSLTLYENGKVMEYSNKGQKRIIETIRSKLEYKTMQDIIESSNIVYFYDKEYIKDEPIIELYKQLYSVTESPIPDDFVSLRLEFKSETLEYIDTSIYEIAKKLEHYGCKVICSDDNSDNIFIRFISNSEEELRKIEISCMNIKIKGITDIERVFTRKININDYSDELGIHKKEQWIFETEGSNIVGSLDIEGIDHTKTISNNILEIYEFFGIEAARQALLNELRIVLSFDGSYVNYRHLAILVDTMTCRGSLTAMTRHGINRVVDAGTLYKCSFEETVEILTDAAAFAEYDGLKGISDNIMLGQMVPAGTGSFEVLYDPDMKPDIKTEINQYTNYYIPSEPNYDPYIVFDDILDM